MKVVVKDIIDYLSKYPENTEVFLDKNGWWDGLPSDAIKSIIEPNRDSITNELYLLINN